MSVLKFWDGAQWVAINNVGQQGATGAAVSGVTGVAGLGVTGLMGATGVDTVGTDPSFNTVTLTGNLNGTTGMVGNILFGIGDPPSPTGIQIGTVYYKYA